MTSLPAEATTNVIQASVQKEIPTAGNVEGIAPGGTQNNATAGNPDFWVDLMHM